MHRLSKIYPKQTARLILVLFISTVGLGLMTLFFYDFLRLRLFLLWNVFLALLPLVVSTLLLLREHSGKHRLPTVLLLFCWLFFFPNAPYMITDLVHITRYEYYAREVGFLPSPLSWFGMMHIVLGIIIGVLFGMISLYTLHKQITRSFGKGIGWGFVGVVSLLSGIAITIGRFMRFNSWDIVTRPFYLLKRIWNSLSPDTFLLYLIFGVMTLFSYLLFYVMIDREKTDLSYS